MILSRSGAGLFKAVIVAAVLVLSGCDQDAATEWTFRKTLEFQLKGECQNDACKLAVSTQIKACMVKANWRDYIEKKDDEVAQEKFLLTFFPCFVDTAGVSYF